MALLEIDPAASRRQTDDPFVLDGLFAAVSAGDVQKVQDALLTLPDSCDLNQRCSTGDTVVHLAVRSQSLAVLQALADRGADLHQLNSDCENGLHLACRCGWRRVAERLLDASVCPDGQNREGESPLHLATRNCHCDLVQLLCQRGANPEARDRNQRSAMHVAAELGHCSCARLLLLAGADLEPCDREGRSPLQLAVLSGQAAMSLLLIEAGARVDHCDSAQESPLHAACSSGQLELVQALCAFGCSTEMLSHSGVTPLQLASRAGHVEIVRCLLLAGASPQLASRKGVLPEVMALAQGHSKTASLLAKMRPERREICVNQLVPTERVLPRIKLKVFGHSCSGKTTLIDSLRSNRITGFFRRKLKSLEEASWEDEESSHGLSLRQRSLPSEINFDSQHEAYTRGVSVQNLCVTGAGEFSIWEFSGYQPYFAFYDHFIGDTSCVHVIVVSLADSLDVMRQKALFWAEFLLSRLPAREPLGFCGRPRSLAKILILFTNADRASCSRGQRGLLDSQDAERVLDEVLQAVQFRAEVCNEAFVLDSSDANSAEIKALRQRLSEWRESILKQLPRSNGFFDVAAAKVADWATDTQFPVLTWLEFVNEVRAQVNPLCSEDHLKDLVQQLQFTGDVIYLETDQQQLQQQQQQQQQETDLIILSPNWLCCSILGSLLSFENVVSARVTGSFSADDVQLMLAGLDATQLLPVLQALDLCSPVLAEDFVQCNEEDEEEEEWSYEFPCLNFLESFRGQWEKEPGQESFLHAGAQLRAGRSQLVHIFPRIQCSLRRCLQPSVVEAADLFLWFHGCKLTIGRVECLLRMEECEQVIRIRARGPQQQVQLLFEIYQDMLHLLHHAIEGMCPGMEPQLSILGPKELQRHSKLVLAVPQAAIYSAILQQQPIVEYEEGLVEESLESLLCFGSGRLLQQLRLGPDLHITSLRMPTLQRLCSLLDPQHPHGKDWCLLAVQLGMTQCLPSIDAPGGWLRSRTARILDDWAPRPEATVGRLLSVLAGMGRHDACSLLLGYAQLYAYEPLVGEGEGE